MSKEKLIKSTYRLYSDIDRCITRICDAKRYHSAEDLAFEHSNLERLAIDAQQQLGCVLDYFDLEEKDAEEPKWISVEERLPNELENVLVMMENIHGYINPAIRWRVARADVKQDENKFALMINEVRVHAWFPIPKFDKNETESNTAVYPNSKSGDSRNVRD